MCITVSKQVKVPKLDVIYINSDLYIRNTIFSFKFKLLIIMDCLNTIGFRMLKYLICVLLLSGYVDLNAQSHQNTFEKVLIEIDGEEVHDVSEITQDHKGYMWMATNLGLIRYNGIEAEKYEHRINGSTTNEDNIEAIYVDSKDVIWIGSRSGLSVYNPECDCLFPYPSINNGPSITGIMSITEDKNKNIWIGTKQGELFRYERESESFSRFLFNSSDSSTIIQGIIMDLLVDQYNNLWIGTNTYLFETSSGLLRYNIDTEEINQFLHDPTNPNSLSDNRIRALYEDKEGQILIGTDNCGLHKYNAKNELISRYNFNADNPVQLHAPSPAPIPSAPPVPKPNQSIFLLS